MHRRTLLGVAAAATMTRALPASAEELLPIYNLVGNFMNWRAISDAYAARTGVRSTLGLRSGSSPALVAMRMEASQPQAAGSYWSLDVAVEAKKAGVTAAYRPQGFDIIPEGLKDPDGHWWAMATTNVVIGVNNEVLERRNLAPPRSYADLLKPEYRGLVACMDPTWSGTASVFLYGINFVLGGTKTDFRPGMRWLKAYAENGNQFRSELVAPRLATGDAAVTLDAEGNILLSKDGGAPLSTVVPAEGVVSAALGMSVARNGVQPDRVRHFVDWLLGPEAQGLIAEGYFRPVRADVVTPRIASAMPDVSAVPRPVLDIQHQAEVLAPLKRAFVEIVTRGGDVERVLRRHGLAG
jgi:putative spermidine/putrescine transport system substrate-binding protein